MNSYQLNSITETYPGFCRHALNDRHLLWSGFLPMDLPVPFEPLWALHPAEYHEILMHGRHVKTPRWQQAYGRSYFYAGRVNSALPVPELLVPVFHWATENIDARLNGILLNWYDGKLGHYIGRHRDSTVDLVPNSPIVTVSLGDTRHFRLRRMGQPGFRDFVAEDRAVFVMPSDTNRNWTHEVPASTKHQGRRISITLRAFQ